MLTDPLAGLDGGAFFSKTGGGAFLCDTDGGALAFEALGEAPLAWIQRSLARARNLQESLKQQSWSGPQAVT